jgi:hypothetical protein
MFNHNANMSTVSTKCKNLFCRSTNKKPEYYVWTGNKHANVDQPKCKWKSAYQTPKQKRIEKCDHQKVTSWRLKKRQKQQTSWRNHQSSESSLLSMASSSSCMARAAWWFRSSRVWTSVSSGFPPMLTPMFGRFKWQPQKCPSWMTEGISWNAPVDHRI